jgi:hypothetical protein
MINKYPHFKGSDKLSKEMDTLRRGNRTTYNNNYLQLVL